MDMQAVVDVARTAGSKILEVYARDDFGTRLKSDDSPLTEADLAAHHEIVGGLTQLDSSIPVLSEEAAAISWEFSRAITNRRLSSPL